jgi:hypothetical protein
MGVKLSLVTLREEHRLRMIENRVLRRIFGPKRDEVAGGGWRKLHNEELHNLYSSPHEVRLIISRRMRWEEHLECTENVRYAYKRLIGDYEKTSWKTQTWTGKNNNKMELEMRQNRDQWQALVITVLNLRFPLKHGHFLTN